MCIKTQIKVKRHEEKNKVHLIRYADDFIITAKNQSILQNYILPALKTSLYKRGLELNMEKTTIVNMHEGFNFLGFQLKRYPYNYKLNNNRGKAQQKTVLIVKPTKDATKALKLKIKEIIQTNKPIQSIIRDLNPILRG